MCRAGEASAQLMCASPVVRSGRLRHELPSFASPEPHPLLHRGRSVGQSVDVSAEVGGCESVGPAHPPKTVNQPWERTLHSGTQKAPVRRAPSALFNCAACSHSIACKMKGLPSQRRSVHPTATDDPLPAQIMISIGRFPAHNLFPAHNWFPDRPQLLPVRSVAAGTTFSPGVSR